LEIIMFDFERRDIAALREAYIDTCRAHRNCAMLVERRGPVAPLVDLRDDAARQIEKLAALFQRCGIERPDLDSGAPIRRFTTIPQAVAAALYAKERSAAAAQSLQIVVRETPVGQPEHQSAGRRQ
jgi:hypothetical protein